MKSIFIYLPLLSLILGGCTSPMQKAAYKGDVNTLRQLVDSGADVNEGMPLAHAIIAGNKNAVVYLLAQGVDSNGIWRKHSFMFHAIYRNYWDIAKILLDEGVDAESAAAEYDTYGMSYEKHKNFPAWKAKADRLRRMAGIQEANPSIQLSAKSRKRRILRAMLPPQKNVLKRGMVVAVLNLKGEGVSEKDSRIISDLLQTSIVKKNIFTVIERSQLENVLKEQLLHLTVCNDIQCAIQVGKLLDASIVILGSVGKLGDFFIVAIRAVNVNTGKVEYADMTRSMSLNNIDQSINTLVDEMANIVQ